MSNATLAPRTHLHACLLLIHHCTVQYLAREQRMALDGDRGELRTIKRELDGLRHVSLLQEAGQALSTAATASTTATSTYIASNTINTAVAGGGGGAPAAADSSSGVNGSGGTGSSKSDELQRLVQWREDLRQAGGYDEGHPILSQLTRQIQLLQS
jgi:hypothetical protein